MTYGIIVARDGYSVETATVLQQVFNSQYTSLKTLDRLSTSNTNTGLRTITLATNAYRCGFLAWFEVADSGKWFPMGSIEHLSGASGSVNLYVDNSFVLYAEIYTSSNQKVDIKYYLLADPGA